VSVEPYHLYRYLDEQMFRFNNRKDLDDVTCPRSSRTRSYDTFRLRVCG